MYTTRTVLTVQVLGFIALAALILGWAYVNRAQASVTVGNEYQYATTTSGTGASVRTAKTGYGSLAQVTITGKNAGITQIYDATTSDITKRTGQTATSSLLIAEIPSNAPEGTYTFDDVFTRGLLIVTSGTPATSTISYR
jgi:hypothetical protein